QDGRVTFHCKDYADGHKSKTMTLTAEEFLRRFVQHVLPKGFVKMRHYGLLANRHREELLTRCRCLLLAAAVPAAVPGPATHNEPARARGCPPFGMRPSASRALARGDCSPPQP